MGAALVRTLASDGLRVAAWNRTFSRAEALAGANVTPARDVAAGIAASDLVLACTANYGNLYDTLDEVRTWNGQLLVNLTSGTPHDSETFAAWAAQREIDYLDGSVISYPRAVGTPDAYFAYSGSRQAWERAEPVLKRLGTTRFMPGSPGLSSTLLQGMAAFYTSALSSFVESAKYLLSTGVPEAAVAEATASLARDLKGAAAEAVQAVRTGEHATDQATLDIFAEGVDHALADFAANGMSPRILTATRQSLAAAQEAGLGGLGISAQAKTF